MYCMAQGLAQWWCRNCKTFMGTCLKLGPHPYAVTETTYKQRRTSLGREGICDDDSWADAPGSILSTLMVSATHVCRHVGKKVSGCIYLNP